MRCNNVNNICIITCKFSSSMHLELYCNNLLSTSVVKLVCMGLQCDWSCCYSRDILVRLLKISERLLHRGSDKQGGGCDVVHGAENSKHLLELPGASDRLKLFVAELMEPGCFDNVVEGCDGVFHTASPVLFKDITDPQVFFFFFTLQIFTLLFMLQLVAKSNVFGRFYFALIQNKR